MCCFVYCHVFCHHTQKCGQKCATRCYCMKTNGTSQYANLDSITSPDPLDLCSLEAPEVNERSPFKYLVNIRLSKRETTGKPTIHQSLAHMGFVHWHVLVQSTPAPITMHTLYNLVPIWLWSHAALEHSTVHYVVIIRSLSTWLSLPSHPLRLLLHRAFTLLLHMYVYLMRFMMHFMTPPSFPPSYLCPSHAIYANRLYLSLFKERHPEYLATSTPGGPEIYGAVRIHPSAQIDPSAVVRWYIHTQAFFQIHLLMCICIWCYSSGKPCLN